MSQSTVAGRSRILICRLSHIGDCILTLPMVSALRQAVPKAWIAWAMEKPSPQLLDGHPHVDEIITIPKGWLKKPKTIWAVRRRLRQYDFDIAIDPQSIAKSALLARVSGAKIRLGFRGEHGRELSSWFNNRCIQPKTTHLVDRSLELLDGLGIENREARFALPLRDSADCYVNQFLGERGLADARYVVINPGASWPSKRWENDRFAQVARQFHQKTGLTSIVTWGGDAELEMATSICAGASDSAILAPQTDLQQLTSLLKGAELYVGCDTGPMHMAAAVGTTCVGLYGPTRPQDSGAYGQHHFALQNQYESGTSRHRRSASNRAMRSIQVEQVVDACCRALGAARVAETETRDDSVDRAA